MLIRQPLSSRPELGSRGFDRWMGDFYKTNLENLKTLTKVISLEMNYWDFLKFKYYTPPVLATVDGAIIGGRSFGKTVELNETICNFLIDFIINCAVKNQDLAI